MHESRRYASALVACWLALLVQGCGLVGYESSAAPSGSVDGGLTPDAAPAATVVGMLDPDFGSAGAVTFNYVDDDATSKDDRATAVAIDSLGRIVVAASGTYLYYANDDQVDMAAITMRLLADGSFDSTYQYGVLSSPGTTINTDSLWSHATDVFITSTDDVVACGYREWSGTDDPTIFRHGGADGQPYPSFGTAGVANIPVSGEVQGTGCTVDPTDGTTVVVGSRSSQAMVVAKIYTSTGAAVPAFGGGTAVYDTAGNEHANDVVVDGLGRIYVVGSSDGGGAMRDVTVWRYLSDGSLDGDFGANGLFVFDDGGTDDVALAGALAPDGNLLVTGTTIGLDANMLVLKIDAQTGALDATFADGGVFRFDSAVGDSVDEGNGILVAGTDIWVTGRSSTATATSMAVWKLSSPGTLDGDFGGMSPSPTAGVFLTPTVGAIDTGWDLAVTADGDLVVVGETQPDGEFADVAVWKLR